MTLAGESNFINYNQEKKQEIADTNVKVPVDSHMQERIKVG